jgi:hypothetical protein
MIGNPPHVLLAFLGTTTSQAIIHPSIIPHPSIIHHPSSIIQEKKQKHIPIENTPVLV